MLLALACLATACGSGTQRSRIQVTLTAQNHRPRAGDSPSVHWWYCVRVRSAAGNSIASGIQLRILKGGRLVRSAGTVSLHKGYDHWCASIGGEASLMNALPRGTKLVFEAVVTADDQTVTRSWPIVVR